MKASLPCPHCHAALAPSEILAASTAFASEGRLLALHCPRCGRDLQAQARPGHVAIGPTVEHADDFRPSASAAAPGLVVTVEGEVLTCRYHGREHRFAAPPGRAQPPRG